MIGADPKEVLMDFNQFVQELLGDKS